MTIALKYIFLDSEKITGAAKDAYSSNAERKPRQIAVIEIKITVLTL